MESRFEILFVCTGNICRSPLAEAMLRQQLAGAVDCGVASAGTHALAGEPMSDVTRRMGRRHGLDGEEVDSHVARQLTEEELASADLVLTMTRDQRRQVVELSPRTTRRVFTLLEFARLAEATDPQGLGGGEGAPVDRLRDAVRTVSRSRAKVPPLVDPAGIDVPDPYRQPEDVHLSSSLLIHRAVGALADVLHRSARGPDRSPGVTP